MVCGMVEMDSMRYLTSLLFTDNNIINMKIPVLISVILITISSCSTEKNVVVEQSNNTQHTTRSRSLESQHELAVIMRSWTQEQRDEFRRKYVYSEVDIFLKNGDTLTVK